MRPTSIFYFDREGRENLPHVLRVVKRGLKKRPDLRSLKLIIFTATGEGPALACTQLHEYDPRIIAVTFPPDCTVRRGDKIFHPQISGKLRSFFDAVGVKVVTGRLPFDPIEGMPIHNEQMQLLRNALTVFGSSFSLVIQGVLAACDAGEVQVGETVISITGDTAAIVTASSTRKFLSKEEGLAVNEILCKPRNLTYGRKAGPPEIVSDATAQDEKRLTRKIIDVHALPEKNNREDE